MIYSQTESDTTIMLSIIMSTNTTEPNIKIIPLERYIFTTSQFQVRTPLITGKMHHSMNVSMVEEHTKKVKRSIQRMPPARSAYVRMDLMVNTSFGQKCKLPLL